VKIVAQNFRELSRGGFVGWNRFWFTPCDPATLGMIRLLAGGMLLYTHLVWGLDLVGFLGSHGRLSPEFVQQLNGSPFAWSYLFAVASPHWLLGLHAVALVVLLLFTLGVASRVTSVLAFLVTVSYAHRASGALFGLDQINGMLALYLMVGPSGRAYSIDRWWAGRRTGQPSAGQPLVSANVAIRLIQLHMCLIYLVAGCGKLLGASWWEGTALWGALANLEYQTWDMTWLAGCPLVINFVTQLTLAWEVSYAALVWPRLTRPLVLALAVPLHLGIAVGMGMITFGLVMLIGNLAFVSPALVRGVTGGLGRWLPGRASGPSAGRALARQPAR